MKQFILISFALTLLCFTEACSKKDQTISPPALTGLEGTWLGNYYGGSANRKDTIKLDIKPDGKIMGIDHIGTNMSTINIGGSWGIIDTSFVARLVFKGFGGSPNFSRTFTAPILNDSILVGHHFAAFQGNLPDNGEQGPFTIKKQKQ